MCKLLAVLAYVSLAQAAATRVLQLPSGVQVLVGARLVNAPTGLYPAATERWRIALAPVNGSFGPYPGLLGGSGNDIPEDAAVDSAGNVWVVGETDSDDFHLVNPIFAQKVSYRTEGFVLELDPTGTKLLFASYLAGQQGSTYSFGGFNFCSTSATAITADAAGNVYVGGATNEADLFAAPPVNLNSTACDDNFANSTYYSFAARISPAGKLIYGKRLITGASQCIGGSRCINQMSAAATVSSLAADSTGALTVAGTAGGSWNPGHGYILKLAADGAGPLWSAATPSTFQAVLQLAMAQDASGNILVLGQYAAVVLPICGCISPEIGTPGVFAAKLAPDGSAFLYLADLGPSADAQVAGLALDAAGNPWLAGTSSSPQFPAVGGGPNLGPDFVLSLDGSGAPRMLFRLPHGVVTAPPAFDLQGNLLLVGTNNWLATLPLSYTTPAIVAFANSASLALNTGLVPGALLTLFGIALPAGAQVTIDTLPAPILYSGPNQINLQVPFGSSLGQMQVALPGRTLSLQLPPSPAIGIFTVDGVHAAALNQDGTVNSASNPAAAGSVVTVFGTGAVWPAGMADGAPAAAAIPTYNSFALADPPEGSAVLYAGTSPGLLDGVFQVNLQLPVQPVTAFVLQETGPFPALPGNPFSLYVKQLPSTSAGLGMPRRANSTLPSGPMR